jgi:uncharacterized SAM-binding protein YcdF (DUF218 family)
MNTFAFLKIATSLIFPPASLAVAVVLAGLLTWVGRRRFARVVLGVAIAETLILAFPPVGDGLVTYLENQSRTAAREAPACCYDAIVVLGGGISPAHPPEQPEPDLNDSSDRIWEAARLYHRGVAPRIVISGGSFLAQNGGPPTTEADAMLTFLVALGVPAAAIVNEPMALNTIDNIRFVRALVGDKKVALVTSASHMPRALKLARRAGLNVGAFPTDFEATPLARLPWDNWLPSTDALRLSAQAIREIIALHLDFRGSVLDK